MIGKIRLSRDLWHFMGLKFKLNEIGFELLNFGFMEILIIFRNRIVNGKYLELVNAV